MPIKNPKRVAELAMRTLRHDRDNRLLKIDRYEKGDQDHPFTPESADAEFKLLAERSITNVFPFLLGTPAQMMKADSFRRGRTSAGPGVGVAAAATNSVQPEWDHWQKSRLDGKQAAIYRGALKFGHSFVLTEKHDKHGAISKGLSALKTIALYEDPANDDDAYAALTITRFPVGHEDADDFVTGLGRLFDDTFEYVVEFKSFVDEKSIRVSNPTRHGATSCPVTRFAAAVDLEGRTMGIVEPMFVLQDRLNQTVFDMLIVQSFASFKVRTISGMAPPIKLKAVDADGNSLPDGADEDHPDFDAWVPVIKNGRPVPDEINLNAKRVFMAEDEDTKFDTLDETPLDGFIKAIELGFRHIAALSQTPPHHILGEIANLSADALKAAELSLSRKVNEFKTSFGESWERVFRVAAEIGDFEGVDDYSGELIWRDVDLSSLAQTADALVKLRELGVPDRGLWGRIPNVTANEQASWEEMRKEEQPGVALASATTNAGTGSRPSFRRAAAQDEGTAA